jgi:hypothetical protein
MMETFLGHPPGEGGKLARNLCIRKLAISALLFSSGLIS